MQRLVDVLGTTRHRYIVSKGPQADRITLADNMVGAQMLPQTKVIPQVDLVISHGGNNTVTETLHFGKPLIVLPLFWDQYENAQRIDELGFGVRLDTYKFADDELTGAVDRLLADTELRAPAGRDRRRDPRPRRVAGGRRRHRKGGRATSGVGCLRPLDALDLTDGKRLAIVADDDGLAALPMVRDPDGRWRRASAGDGVAEALLDVLAARVRARSRRGSSPFSRGPSVPRSAREAIGVDQTNESVIVGDAAVVKWATHLQEGPHPAPRRIAVLREAGFGGMPTPWGLVTWRPADGAETLAASVDGYLPGAVDGWTWAVDLITAAAGERRRRPRRRCGRTGRRSCGGHACGAA